MNASSSNGNRPPRISADVREGALNILRNCAGVVAGNRILIVGEQGKKAYFDLEVCQAVEEVARQLGATTSIVVAPETSGPQDFPLSLAQAMEQVDHTIFFARIGDQVRFHDLPGRGTKTMCYTHDIGYLGDAFGRVHYRLYADILDILMKEFDKAQQCQITCPGGTDLSGRMLKSSDATKETGPIAAQFSVNLFPVMIFPPLSCSGFSGTLLLNRWLTSTSTNDYANSLLKLEAQVLARVENGRIVGFRGAQAQVALVDEHFRAVSAANGGDPYAVNSWHTGIYPKTYFREDPLTNIEKWADLVYGSPRYTHFHTCGHDPGDICVSIFDATISLDGKLFWDRGRFLFLERPEIFELLERYNCSPSDLEMRWDIGI